MKKTTATTTDNTCPKCKTGKLYGDKLNYVSDVIKCNSCGLFHAVGASKESLYRQIYGVNPAVTDRRAASLHHD